ncbi:hypothetical protein F5Y16DRAFT_288128 [Xylariaceae sp. FL0255]|nr:hypothetical protein F5Y16DRAFT_288128 [Xylariaceae sp. FL0255]
MPRHTILALWGLLASATAANYTWTLKWTGPQVCTSYPCPYSYNVTGSKYIIGARTIPPFRASCKGIVDEPLTDCTLASPDDEVAMGNFSSFETSGVGAGVITFSAEWLDMATCRVISEKKWPNMGSGENETIKASTPMKGTTANNETWVIDLGPCPLSGEADCN